MKASSKHANACAHAIKIASQLVPLAKIVPKATKHLPTFGNTPFSL
jgi:hypothetical protein